MKGIFERLQDAISQNSKESFDCCMALINWFGEEKGWNPAEIWTLTARRTFALHRAAEAGSTEMVEAMIKLGVGKCRHFVMLLIHMLISIGMSG